MTTKRKQKDQTFRLAIEPPTSGEDKMRTLWRVKLKVGTEDREALFRASEDFEEAAGMATKLVLSSPGSQMVGATIVGINRIARLWN